MMRYLKILGISVFCLSAIEGFSQDLLDQGISLEGQWQAYNEIDGAVTQRLPFRYVFGKVGWGIKNDENDVIVQDWYRALGNQLLLRYGNVPAEISSNAVIRAVLEKDAFRLQDPLNENRKILFERVAVTNQLAMKDIKGRYFIEQRREGEKAFEKSPFSILIDEKGSYRFEPIPTNNVTAARGQIVITNDYFIFKPKSKVIGFWNEPKFFKYQDTFVYDNPYLAIRLIQEN